MIRATWQSVFESKGEASCDRVRPVGAEKLRLGSAEFACKRLAKAPRSAARKAFSQCDVAHCGPSSHGASQKLRCLAKRAEFYGALRPRARGRVSATILRRFIDAIHVATRRRFAHLGRVLADVGREAGAGRGGAAARRHGSTERVGRKE